MTYINVYIMDRSDIDLESWKNIYILLNVALFGILFIVSFLAVYILICISNTNINLGIHLILGVILAMFLYPKRYSVTIYRNAQKYDFKG